MMKEMMTAMFAMAFFVGCQKPSAGTGSATRVQSMASVTNLIEVPVGLPSSDLVGLSESQILKKEALETLNPVHGAPGQKWFSGGIVHFPSAPGDSNVIERCHFLIFKNGKVVKHEIMDQLTAHVTIQPRDE